MYLCKWRRSCTAAVALYATALVPNMLSCRGGVGGYEMCMISWGMREHGMFLTVKTLPLFSASRNCC